MLKYLLGFSLIQEIGPQRFKKLEDHFDSPELAWKSGIKELQHAGIDSKTAEKIVAKKKRLNIEKEVEKLKEENITPVSKPLSFPEFKGVNQDKFPENLTQLNDCPFLLFCKGNLELLKKHQISVVGSRKPTHYGQQVIDKIVTKISSSGIVITSGMALGTDALAHKAALANSNSTIAVLGNGLSEKILQKSVNFNLSREILNKGGLLVSEYSPTAQANRFTFPARNRIISGLSAGVLIIEAGNKSGTLITASHALDQNREIFAVPGNIFSPQSAGTNKLIQEGAMPTICAEDILEQLNWHFKNQEPQKEIYLEDETEKLIYQHLDCEPCPIDKISLKCKLDISAISVKLSMMEIKGLVKNVDGGYVRN
ncbi:MAG: DNA-processing protein DprA [Candidatus Moraniibacteriota bacterium]